MVCCGLMQPPPPPPTKYKGHLFQSLFKGGYVLYHFDLMNHQLLLNMRFPFDITQSHNIRHLWNFFSGMIEVNLHGWCEWSNRAVVAAWADGGIPCYPFTVVTSSADYLNGGTWEREQDVKKVFTNFIKLHPFLLPFQVSMLFYLIYILFCNPLLVISLGNPQ